MRAAERDGERQVVIGYMTDITEERALSDALEATRNDLEEAVASGPGWFYRLTVFSDSTARLDYVSGNVERVTGFSQAEASSSNWIFDNIDASTAQIMRDNLPRLLRLERVAAEYRLRTKSGDWIWISDTMNPQRQPDGSVRAFGFMADITQVKEQAAQLQQAAKLVTLGEMAGGMAHELRQPLTTISFASQNAAMAMDRNDAASVRKALTRIQQQTVRANSIIEHLRQFARGADANAAVVPVALDTLIASTLTLVGESLRLESIEVSSDLGDPVPAVMGQQLPLEQVLVNLLLNARDALAANQPPGARRIRIAAARVPGQALVKLSIADNAGGVAADVLPLIFQPFVTTKLATKGTGLGLSICHGIVSSLGGQISARNEDGGAVFTMTLPAAE